MKKTLAIILAAVLCLCLLPMAAFAAREAETFTVHVKVPDDWKDVTLGAWYKENGEDVIVVGTEWWGALMTLGADGWYTYDVPVTATNLLITSEKGNGHCAEGISGFEPRELWIVAKDGHDNTYSYEKPADEQPVTPPPTEEVETFTVHAKVPEGWTDVTLGAWGEKGDLMGAWYGKPMTLGADGWYTIEVPVTATGMIITSNNGGGETTQNIEGFEAKEMWITACKYDDGVPTIAYEKPAEVPPVEEPPKEDPPKEDPPKEDEKPAEKPVEKTTFTVHAKVPADWKDVTLGAWNDKGDLMGEWFGKPMTKGADGWYTIEVPLNATGMIITADNGAGETTQDIKNFEAKEMWITACKYDDGVPTISYAAPKTGDSAYLAAACGILIVSLCALAAAVSLRKKVF